MNVNRMAKLDAHRWASAEMFYGKGAGTRRKLLEAEIANKQATLPGYYDRFLDEYHSLDMNVFAKQAIKERKRIDRGASLKRNAHGLATGNRRSLTTGVGLLATAYILAKETGMDEPIKAEVKARYEKAKRWIQDKKIRKENEQKFRDKFKA